MARLEDICLVCGSRAFTPLYYPTRSPGPLARCNECDFVFVLRIENDRSIIDDGTDFKVSEELLTGEDPTALSDCWEFRELPAKLEEAPALRINAQDALRRIAQYRQPPGSLLDFGCGWGFFLGAAREQGWSIHGLEPLPGHAVYAHSKFGADVTTNVLRDNTFPPNYFDVITAFQVFEHLPDPAGNLALLHRTLRDGGILLVEVPNIDTWGVKLMGKRHRHFVPDHLNFFSAETLSRLFISQGYEVLSHYYPTRQMSVRHLTSAWGARILPERMFGVLSSTLEGSALWDRTFGLNLGDIVAVIARKAG